MWQIVCMDQSPQLWAALRECRAGTKLLRCQIEVDWGTIHNAYQIRKLPQKLHSTCPSGPWLQEINFHTNETYLERVYWKLVPKHAQTLFCHSTEQTCIIFQLNEINLISQSANAGNSTSLSSGRSWQWVINQAIIHYKLHLSKIVGFLAWISTLEGSLPNNQVQTCLKCR